MQNELNKSNKIILDTRHENKAKKTGYLFSHFRAKSSILNHILDSKHEIEIKP